MQKELHIDCLDSNIAALIAHAASEPAHVFDRVIFDNRPESEGGLKQGDAVAFQYFRFGFGGAEHVVQILMEEFLDWGFRVLLYTDFEAEEDDYKVPAGAERIIVSASYDEQEQRVAYWRNEVEKRGIKLVVYNSWCSPAALLDCLAIQSTGARCAYYVHGSTPFFMQINDSPLPLRLERLGRCADAVIVLSDMDAVFWRAYSNRVLLVANPIERYMRNIPLRKGVPQGKTILWSGRFSSREKRPKEALLVFSEVLRHVPDARLIMLGSGDEYEKDEVFSFADELGLLGDERVLFEGFQKDPYPYYHVANVLLVTSFAEGFPLVLSEAMHQGVPVVSYELPFIQLSKYPGIIQVPQLDSQAAAQEICALLENPDLQQKCSETVRECFKKVCCVDLRAQWQEAFDICFEASNLTPSTPIDTELEDARLMARTMMYSYRTHCDLVDNRIGCLDDEIQRLRGQLDELSNSTSFRVGKAVTILPRAVKRAIGF